MDLSLDPIDYEVGVDDHNDRGEVGIERKHKCLFRCQSHRASVVMENYPLNYQNHQGSRKKHRNDVLEGKRVFKGWEFLVFLVFLRYYVKDRSQYEFVQDVNKHRNADAYRIGNEKIVIMWGMLFN